MEGFLMFLLYIVFPILTGWLASKRNRSSFGWFILGILFPIIALPLVLILPSKRPRFIETTSGYQPPSQRPPAHHPSRIIENEYDVGATGCDDQNVFYGEDGSMMIRVSSAVKMIWALNSDQIMKRILGEPVSDQLLIAAVENDIRIAAIDEKSLSATNHQIYLERLDKSICAFS